MKWCMKIVSRSKKKGGFTLVELMIVVVIVGILAAVALGMYRGYVKKAIATEGTAGLGTVRTGLRVVYAETQDYTDDGAGNVIAAGLIAAQVPGIDLNDLLGTYFSHADYHIDEITSGTFKLRVLGTGTSGQGANTGKAIGVVRYMNELGDLRTTDFP